MYCEWEGGGVCGEIDAWLVAESKAACICG